MKRKKNQQLPINKGPKSELRRIEERNGYLFIAPWIFGFIFFFLRPLISSIQYAFNKVTFTPNGIMLEFVGLENFIYKFRDDYWFSQKTFVPSVSNFLIEVPLVVIFSLFIAMILNQNFRGRIVARVMFFLPVIIASGIVIQILRENGMDTNLDSENAYVFNSGGLEMLLSSIGIPNKLMNILTNVSNKIFDIVWLSGIQIILYLSGLQGIPRLEYEAAWIEGATSWETFWKITWPRISPMTLVVVVYSIIDSFTNVSNGMILFIQNEFLKNGNMGGSIGMGWLYCGIALIVLTIISGIISKYVFYMNED